MEYIYAALLLHAAKKEITEESVQKVLTAAGVEVNEAKVKALVSSLKEVNIDEAIKQATVAPVAQVSAPAAPQAAEQKSEKKEEKKDEKKAEEEAAAGLASLFG